jgi:hypothetical protein
VIDDATGALLHGVFALQEDAQSYLMCLKQILLEKGIPLAVYMDRHGIFHRNDDHWSLQEQISPRADSHAGGSGATGVRH